MTTAIGQVIDEVAATEALQQIEKIERALDRAYQTIADSLGLADRKAVEKQVKHLRDDVIKPYLIEHGGSIADGELAVSARVTGKNNYSYDLVTVAQTAKGPDALVEAARAGMLRLDNTSLERFRGSAGASWADLLFRFRQVGSTPALTIERGK